MNGLTLMSHVSIITDHRQNWKVVHSLPDILFLTITATIAGCDGWEEISDFGDDNIDWLKKFSDFKGGVPSYHTIGRVFSAIDPRQFRKVFAKWMNDCQEMTHGETIAIDGKCLKGSYHQDDKKDAIYMVSAFAEANEVVLGQVKVESKSNEITAVPKLLDLLDIRGCLITIDAMGCQTKIAKKIVDKGCDYLLAVKGNQGRLFTKLNEIFNVHRLNSASKIFSAKVIKDMEEKKLDTIW